MRPGKIKVINGKLYTICAECGSIVRVDKPILGSLHLCYNAVQRDARKE